MTNIDTKVNKLWGGLFNKNPSQQVQEFLSGRDVRSIPPADEILLPYDITASKAHARMLNKEKYISNDELNKLLYGLSEIAQLHNEGKFGITFDKEDVHTAIESYLIKKFGIETGGKIHTARSRNDQIVTATRLFLRDAVSQFTKDLNSLITTLKSTASEHEDTKIPGYTHYQKAMPTTFATILDSFTAMFARDLDKFSLWLKIWNKNPLGAMAGFGTTLKIDREYTAKLLHFTAVETNTIDTVTSRWEAESDFVYAVTSTMNHLSILAQTFILFSSEHYRYITIDDSFCTGSSIMPQKKNPDVLEVVKGKAAWTIGQLTSLLTIAKGNLIGYNRDTQWTKYIIVDVVRECLPAIVITSNLIKTLTVNKSKMEESLKTGNIYATNYVEKLVKEKGVSLRQAKIQVEKMIKDGTYKEK